MTELVLTSAHNILHIPDPPSVRELRCLCFLRKHLRRSADVNRHVLYSSRDHRVTPQFLQGIKKGFTPPVLVRYKSGVGEAWDLRIKNVLFCDFLADLIKECGCVIAMVKHFTIVLVYSICHLRHKWILPVNSGLPEVSATNDADGKRLLPLEKDVYDLPRLGTQVPVLNIIQTKDHFGAATTRRNGCWR